MDKLNLLKIFVTVVDNGSFAEASNVLELSPSAVSKAISRLEEDLELNLIHRTTRRITVTETGLNYAEHARTMLNELENCELRLQDNNASPKGVLKINVPVSYGRYYVVPTISKFRKQYPGIDVHLHFNDKYVDMIQHGIDITIRSGTLDDSSLVAKKISPMDFLTCASPTYIKNNPPISTDNFSEHTWVRFRFKQSGQLMPILVNKGKKILETDPGRDIIVDDGEALTQLCVDGAGLIQIPHFGVRRWLKDKKLEVVSPYVRPKDFGVWAIYPKRRFTPAKTTCFIQFFEKEIEKLGESPMSTWAEKYSADFPFSD